MRLNISRKFRTSIHGKTYSMNGDIDMPLCSQCGKDALVFGEYPQEKPSLIRENAVNYPLKCLNCSSERDCLIIVYNFIRQGENES